MPVLRRATEEFFTVLDDSFMFLNEEVVGLVNEERVENERNNDPPP